MKCSLCGGENPKTFLVKRGIPILRCTACGLMFVDAPREIKEIANLYAEDYFSNYNRLGYGYENYMGHRHLYFDLFTRRIEELEKHRKGGRLLDVGCATGVFMDVARFRGWEVHGVDVSPFASGVARNYYNLDVFTGVLEESGFPAGWFDVVFMHDVIEHVPDPPSLLTEARRVLTDDGLLVINTPNAAGLLARTLGKRWFHYKPQEHLFYFTPATLTAMLDKAGFRTIRTDATGRVINMEYLIGRLSSDAPALAKILGFLFRGRPFSKSTFTFWTGEFQAFAEKKNGSEERAHRDNAPKPPGGRQSP
ncbi:MAG: class I SAM-dependent methyltransferase [bacterium]